MDEGLGPLADLDDSVTLNWAFGLGPLHKWVNLRLGNKWAVGPLNKENIPEPEILFDIKGN